MYHKIDIITPSMWWVSASKFREQISLLEKKFTLVYLDDYDSGATDQAVITFDDAYENLFNHAFPILRDHRIPFEVFVIGNRVGDWNDFDRDEVTTRFCSLCHLQEMADHGGRIQWHTKNHAYLPGLDDSELESEISLEASLRLVFPEPHFRWFSYPYGKHDERTVGVVKEKYQGAVSVFDGSDSDRYQLNRVIVDEHWSL